ncbi:RidA family protein [Roseovarius sp.]|uniref:RidA family protein n=1 Tax=Roseovarius sp. TaxID=1486281 RepID=UPI00257FD568|nr:RidA family protein [Roseovarius sp.]|tara:strand:- start:3601 stop:3993 length:393 start_codon:yes stop_codon:yes gene_type:complete
MTLKKYNPETLYSAHGQYYNAIEVPPGTTLIYSSGIIGCDTSGEVIKDAPGQIRQAWLNVKAFLDGTGCLPQDLVRLKMHLTNRANLELSKAARIDALGSHMNAAVTGIVMGLFDPELFIEIDVIAARSD